MAEDALTLNYTLPRLRKPFEGLEDVEAATLFAPSGDDARRACRVAALGNEVPRRS
jgi:hypothetical protein